MDASVPVHISLLSVVFIIDCFDTDVIVCTIAAIVLHFIIREYLRG